MRLRFQKEAYSLMAPQIFIDTTGLKAPQQNGGHELVEIKFQILIKSCFFWKTACWYKCL